MKTGTAFFVFMTGLITTLMGVGGVENSIENGDLLTSVIVACVGLSVMFVGTSAMKVSNYYDQQ